MPIDDLSDSFDARGRQCDLSIGFFTSGIYESMQLRILSGPESVQMHTGIPAAVF